MSVDELIGWEPQVAPIRQSNLGCLQSCPRKYMLRHRYLVGRKHRGRSEALDTGSFFHLLMGHRYLRHTEERALQEIGTKIEGILERAYESEGPDGLMPDGRTVAQLSLVLEQNLSLARVMASVFNNHVEFEDKFEVIGVETQAEATIKGLSVPVQGTIDLGIRDKTNDEIWVVDHKTCSEPPKDRVASAIFELQPRIYRVLATGAFDSKVVGVIHNVVQKPGLRMGKEDRDFSGWVDHVFSRGPRKGETEKRKVFTGETPKYENYLERCRRWYMAELDYEYMAAERTGKNLGPPFLQSWVRYTEPVLSRELMVQLEACDIAATRAPDLDVFYRKSRACMSYRRKCEYHDLCTTNPKCWKSMIEDSYERKNNAKDE